MNTGSARTRADPPPFAFPTGWNRDALQLVRDSTSLRFCNRDTESESAGTPENCFVVRPPRRNHRRCTSPEPLGRLPPSPKCGRANEPWFGMAARGRGETEARRMTPRAITVPARADSTKESVRGGYNIGNTRLSTWPWVQKQKKVVPARPLNSLPKTRDSSLGGHTGMTTMHGPVEQPG